MDPVTSRWKQLRPHPVQSALWHSPARFKVIEASRRSGKTELAKMDGACEWVSASFAGWRGLFLAPTLAQARDIYWEDLKAMTPDDLKLKVSETHLEILSLHGATLKVGGLDKAKRIEGTPADKVWVDELADVKPGTWDRTIRPLLSTPGRPGKAWLYGVPRPSAQFSELARLARDPANADEWAYFHWDATDIIDPDELESARKTMDPLTYDQEYGAKRVSFSGRAYYCFEIETHAAFELAYDADAPLELCFDFNNAPGTASAVQELAPPEAAKRILGDRIAPRVTSLIGNVWIPHGSNSEMVANRLIEMYGSHRGKIRGWGDPSGGNKMTSSIAGSDWTIIERIMRRQFGSRFSLHVANAHPPVRQRINSVNSRLRAADGTIRMLICCVRAKRAIEDFDSVMTLQGTAGELDKRDPMLTHISDGVGYYIESRFPIEGAPTNRVAMVY